MRVACCAIASMRVAPMLVACCSMRVACCAIASMRVASCAMRVSCCSMRVACCAIASMRAACCVLRNACGELRASRCVCCVMLDACCVLRNRLNACCANFFTITMLLLVLFDVVPNCAFYILRLMVRYSADNLGAKIIDIFGCCNLEGRSINILGEPQLCVVRGE